MREEGKRGSVKKYEERKKGRMLKYEPSCYCGPQLSNRLAAMLLIGHVILCCLFLATLIYRGCFS